MPVLSAADVPVSKAVNAKLLSERLALMQIMLSSSRLSLLFFVRDIFSNEVIPGSCTSKNVVESSSP